MIKFFRRIRYQFMKETKLNKYLLYAMGEILLVVLGILIALQINNWNEWRKDRDLEIKILNEIKDNIEVDFEDHNQNIEYMGNTIQASAIILDHLENGLSWHDSLAPHFSWLPVVPDFYSVKSGYQLLSSKGVNLITNDSLRKDISFLYDNTQVWVKEFFSFIKVNSFRLLLEDLVPKFSNLHLLEAYYPIDYDQLLDDAEFQSHVQFNMEYLRSFKVVYEDRIKLERDLIDRIEREVGRLEE